MYVKYVQVLCKSRLSTADYALISSRFRYNGNLVTSTVVCLTAAKFKHLIFSMTGFALSNIANIFIVMV
jgi:hypothetical protein